ncbi:uncharacterized protein ASPGLDRAFT_48351 [Aspergillus glaucus CBS 516.65]|uniref:Uncharacterized protein n=1 Tax=Aspergillus glaucus CBS 516.65 TaxID=1160497 RepID=A0A1L9VGK7_ASPGL|nr:hypothetical protein ASPGLDRAFT_48351 [Aspergillus glaucus CBS 516.65]OJJ83015.1 hypothetical protein ASPGLDRAFT_48351 [Aspergillus glaucus CBS 516.65]
MPFCLSPGTGHPFKRGIYRIRRLIQEDLALACEEIQDFHSKYRTYFMNSDKILQSRKIMRVMNLYSDLEHTRPEWQLCRQTIDV